MTTANKQTVLITGASSGIGLELAKIFVKNGYGLVLVARDKKKLMRAAEGLKKSDAPCCLIAKDLSMQGACRELFEELKKNQINVDVLVNNAGFGVSGFFHETSLSSELEMMQVNMVVPVELSKLFLPAMIEKRNGKILNLASTAAFQPGPLMAVYYSSKAFVLSFSEALSNELQGTGVTVTALCPGPTLTGFQKKANIEKINLVKGKKIADAASVALAGFEALMKGNAVVIPGLENSIKAYAARVLPRKMVTKIVRNLQENAQKEK